MQARRDGSDCSQGFACSALLVLDVAVCPWGGRRTANRWRGCCRSEPCHDACALGTPQDDESRLLCSPYPCLIAITASLFKGARCPHSRVLSTYLVAASVHLVQRFREDFLFGRHPQQDAASFCASLSGIFSGSAPALSTLSGNGSLDVAAALILGRGMCR